jgi:transcriptional regulator with XRE-family HTH domain
VDIGARLKAVREMRGFSQRELAKRAGVTNSTISLIEQNRVSPSVGSLHKVLDGLPMTLADFFTYDFETAEGYFYCSEDLVDVSSGEMSMLLVAAKKRDRAMTIMHEFYPPGADTGQERITHRGEEGGVVVRGSIEITIGNETRILNAGDAYYFETHLPHRFRNQGNEVCEIVSSCTPPSF